MDRKVKLQQKAGGAGRLGQLYSRFSDQAKVFVSGSFLIAFSFVMGETSLQVGCTPERWFG